MKNLFALMICLSLVGCATSPVKLINRKYEQMKVKHNAKGATHDIDCEIERRGNKPFCTIHESSDPRACTTIASGNWDRKNPRLWTVCKPVLDEDNAAYCAEHLIHSCTMLATWDPDYPESDDEERVATGPGPDCKKVYGNDGSFCATHPERGCFTQHFECTTVHPGQLCGVIRPGSIERPGSVPVRDGTIVVQGGMNLLSLFGRQTTPVEHTAYVWKIPPPSKKQDRK